MFLATFFGLFVFIASFISPALSNISYNLTTNGQRQLFWSKLRVTKGKNVLIEVPAGEISSGRLLGILGPSGSGKSTFLRTVGSRLSSGLKVSGSISVREGSERKRTIEEDEIAFVHQDDSFFAMLTVRETLTLALKLRKNSDNLYRMMGSSQRSDDTVIRDVITLMGLTKVADNPVGSVGSGDHSHGISGGERKRLSVASELLGNPLLLIADEPTSGLDSFQALQVVTILREVAVDKGLISIVTIHQPRSSIWTLFDDIMLLAPNGKVVYHGPREQAIDYFSGLGFSCPNNTNPAEYLIDLVSVDTTSWKATEESLQRIEYLTGVFLGQTNGISQLALLDTPPTKETSLYPSQKWVRQGGNSLERLWRSLKRCTLLFQRAAKQTVRDSKVNIVRVGVSALLAVVVSSVYGYQGKSITPDTISSRVNIIAQGIINVAMLSMIKTLQLFKKERSVIDRERSQREYCAWEYLFAKATAELPLDALVAAVFGIVLYKRAEMSCPQNIFIGTLSLLAASCSSLGLAVGALAPSGDVALALGPALMVVYVIMGAIGPAGLGIASLPSLLRPFRYFSPIKWACEALCCAEFEGKVFDFTKAIADASTSNGIGRFIGNTAVKGAVLVGKVLRPIVTRLPGVKTLSRIVVRLLVHPGDETDGDRIIKTLGIAGANYQLSMGVLWKMLVSHLGLALLGLMLSKSKE
eukprot:gene9922-10973_t